MCYANVLSVLDTFTYYLLEYINKGFTKLADATYLAQGCTEINYIYPMVQLASLDREFT